MPPKYDALRGLRGAGEEDEQEQGVDTQEYATAVSARPCTPAEGRCVFVCRARNTDGFESDGACAETTAMQQPVDSGRAVSVTSGTFPTAQVEVSVCRKAFP